MLKIYRSPGVPIFTQSESQVSNYFRYFVMAENCNITAYADDIVVIAREEEVLRSMMKRL